MEQLTCRAPAKLNLFLHITGRRADGYHLLQSVFQFIDLCDVLHFTPRRDGELHCVANVESLGGADDLTLRAARLLQAHGGTKLGADIQVNKYIPVGGGLGGGSSDAAAALLILNKLWKLDLERAELAALGLRLGADVPVFIHGRAAWAEGVGEHLTPLENLPEPWYIVLQPDVHVSTAEIFNAPELTRNAQNMKIYDFAFGAGHNDCEAVVCTRYPIVKQALDELARYAPARMSGTGACVFAAFERETAARLALEALSVKWRAWLARGMNQSPLNAVVE